ncbi:MAG: lytic transglycosylase domain-containing protein [Opitutaceae bacterium]|nr:lytic transglycosylase domain-containing protein [Opitutaceae bacterium]
MRLGVILLLLLYPLTLRSQEVAPTPLPEEELDYDPASEVPAREPLDEDSPIINDPLFDAAQQLWQAYVPDTLKEEYEFPSREEWDAFFLRLQDALETDSFAKAAQLAPDVKESLSVLRKDPAFANYSDWLDEKLDLLDAAVIAANLPGPESQPPPGGGAPSSPVPTSAPTPAPSPPSPFPPTGHPITPPPPTAAPTPSPLEPKPRLLAHEEAANVPYYAVWLERIRVRPAPSRAKEILPSLKEIFVAEGVPSELVWLAEVESSLNPEALSPAGARGLFQLMPATARHYGLSTFPLDERSHPEKSARAAAKMLKSMKSRFGNWPLALAAYNAGPGRVSRALKANGGAKATFADIAPSLSVETRMYVPKVLATVAVREPTVLAQLK